MKINREWKIEECVSEDSSRYNLQACHLEVNEGDPRKGNLVATDGRILAVAPVEVEKGDKSGPVSPKALAQARKLSRRHDKAMLTVNAAHELVDGSIIPRPVFPERTSFPDWQEVVRIETGAQRITIGVDVDLLVAAAKAIGTKILRLTIGAEPNGDCVSPIRVEPNMNGDREGQFALVMPYRVKDG